MNDALADYLIPLVEIIWIDILLSGDNAVVIALACAGLPEKQRLRGIILGAGAAVGLRALFTLVLVNLLNLPFLKLGGGLLLFWIAVKLAREEHGEKPVAQQSSIFGAVRTIVIADAIMSLDNVVAIAAAARGSGLLVLFGLALSVPLIIFGSTLVLALLKRFPILIWAGAAMLGFIAGQMIAGELTEPRPPMPDLAWAHWPWFSLACAAAGAVFVVLVALALPREKAKAI